MKKYLVDVGLIFMFLVCHYIASTEIPKFWKKKKDDDKLDAHDGLDLVGNIQKSEGGAKKSLMRRPTIANLSAYHKKTKGKGETIDLEKQFLEKFEKIGKCKICPSINK